jgi:hypothetical protein
MRQEERYYPDLERKRYDGEQDQFGRNIQYSGLPPDSAITLCLGFITGTNFPHMLSVMSSEQYRSSRFDPSINTQPLWQTARIISVMCLMPLISRYCCER